MSRKTVLNAGRPKLSSLGKYVPAQNGSPFGVRKALSGQPPLLPITTGMRGKTGALSGQGTIFALATAPGRSGVAVIRVSGPEAESGIRQLTGRKAPNERKVVVRTLFDPSTGEQIDAGIVLFFRAPHSYT